MSWRRPLAIVLALLAVPAQAARSHNGADLTTAVSVVDVLGGRE